MSATRAERLELRNKKDAERRTADSAAKSIQWKLKRQQACRDKEVIKQKKRNAAQRRRAEERSDPKVQEKIKAKERARYHMRKQQGKIKLRSDMSEREVRVIRKRVRASVKRHRQKMKILVSNELEMSPERQQETETIARKQRSPTEVQLAPVKSDRGPCGRFTRSKSHERTSAPGTCRANPAPESKRAQVMKLKGRNKKAANRSKVHRQLKAQIKANVSLKRALWRSQKLIQKFKENVPLSPRSKVRKQLRGKKISPHIKKQLVFGEVLRSQVQQSMEPESVKEKAAAYQIFRGDLLKKYRMQAMLGLRQKLLAKYRKRTPALQEDRATKKTHLGKVKEVQKFYLSDENSIECADKRASIIQFGKTKIVQRKRYLRGSRKDLYELYFQQTENCVSYSKFCQFKPFNVVEKDLKERDTCLCTQCENMELLLTALSRAKLLDGVNSNLSLFSSLTCSPRKEECYSRTCDGCKEKRVIFTPIDDNEQIKYSKWVKVTEKREGKGGKEKEVKRTIKKEEATSAKNLKEALLTSLEKFLSHTFRDKHQAVTLRDRRQALSPGEAYVWIDFSENYSCKYDREIQSHYYGASRENVVLHTGRIYMHDQSFSFCTATKCTRKDPCAIIAHLLPILEKYLVPGITTLHFQSDSPTNQYRNKVMFHLATQYLPKIFPQITNIYYNYSEAGHGKGAPDGVGSTVKNTLDRAACYCTDVASFEDVVTILKRKLVTIHFDTIDLKAVSDVEEAVPAGLEAFPGTFDLHQFTWTKENHSTVHMNSVSCYMCPAGSECKHFKLKHSPWSPLQPEPATEEENVYYLGGPPQPARKRKSEVDKANKSAGSQPVKKYKKTDELGTLHLGDWVAVRYGLHWYPGVLQKVTTLKVTVNFMVKHTRREDLYLWPPKKDIQFVFKNDILYKLTKPPLPAGKQYFIIPERDSIEAVMF